MPTPAAPAESAPSDGARAHRLVWAALIAVFFAVRLPALFLWSATYDEPIYIGAGKHLLVVGDRLAAPTLYHPPLAYHLTSLPLWFLDTPMRPWVPAGANNQVGLAVLYETTTFGGTPVAPETILFLSRLPILFAGLLGMVFLRALTIRLMRGVGHHGVAERAGLIAAAAWALFPDAAAQGVQATTDLVAAVAAFGLALAWLRHHDAVEEADRRDRTPRTAILLGVAVGLALLAKHTLLLHVATIGGLSVVVAFARRRRLAAAGPSVATLIARLAYVAVIAALVLWAGYGFEWRPLIDPAGPTSQAAPIARALGADERGVAAFLGRLDVPAATWVRSVADALGDKAKARGGTLWTAYLDGTWSESGFLSYFFVAILVKTPVVHLAGMVAGIAAILRWRTARNATLLVCVALFALPFAAAVVARLNIGFRHLLPILPFLFVPAAGGLALLIERFAATRPRRIAAVAVTLAALGAEWLPSIRDPMAFANLPSGGPSKLHLRLSDSNLEMGQDLGHVIAWAKAEGVATLHPILHVPVELAERESARNPGLLGATSPSGGDLYDASRGAVPKGPLRGARVLAVGESVVVLPRFALLVPVEPLLRIGRTRIYRLPD